MLLLSRKRLHSSPFCHGIERVSRSQKKIYLFYLSPPSVINFYSMSSMLKLPPEIGKRLSSTPG